MKEVKPDVKCEWIYDHQALVHEVVRQILHDYMQWNDTTVLWELLKALPIDTLIYALPEECWPDYYHLQKETV